VRNAATNQDVLSRRGIFITLEGIDGTGKSTQHRLLVRRLRALGYRVRATREPGGTQLGEEIRRIVVARQRPRHPAGNEGAASLAPTPLAELALIYAARAQHLEEVVRPALARGEIVVSDRFNDASFAYQGYGRGLGSATVRTFDRIVCRGTQPDLTVLLDLDPSAAMARAGGRAALQRSRLERFEALGIGFQRRVRAGYRAMARQEPRRVKLVRADRSVAEIQNEIGRLVETLLARRGKRKQPAHPKT